MTELERLKNYYQGKRVLLTGHTGFKGSWLTVLLSLLGAEVYGYALPAPTDPSLFELLYGSGSSRKTVKNLRLQAAPAEKPGELILAESRIGDIRDFAALSAYVREVRPEAVIHMAAQPIVRESYRDPRGTFEANIMGTVNLLEALRLLRAEERTEERTEDRTEDRTGKQAENRAENMTENSAGNPAEDLSAGRNSSGAPVLSVLNVTTDKVYLNVEQPDHAFREEEPLDGYDPYSNSKSCSELVTHSYRSSFFGKEDPAVRISTARAGNVIGGGDFAPDRILPDCMRALLSGTAVTLRNPGSTRPYQHVLEPLMVYLTIVTEQARDPELQGAYNVGPDLCDCVTTGELCDLFAEAAPGFTRVDRAEAGAPHEAGFLRLDNTKLKETFGWKPVWHIRDAVAACARWSCAYRNGPEEAVRETLAEITAYLRAMNEAQ